MPRNAKGKAAPTLLPRSALRKYQVRSEGFVLDRPAAALFIDMGLGKTVIMLGAIKRALLAGKVGCVLLVAPIRVMHGVWQQEAVKWAHTQDLKISIVHGSPRKRLQALNTPAHIYIINPDGIRWLVGLYERLRYWPFDGLVIDESTDFKHGQTARFKALRKTLKHYAWRVILTGEPAPNGLMELWSQMFLLDNGERLGTSATNFKARFFEVNPYNAYDITPRPGSVRRVNRLIRDAALRLDAADYLQLPKILVNPVYVELPPAARQVYTQLEKEMFLEMEDASTEVDNAAILTQKCQQVANGALYMVEHETEQRVWRHVHDAKMDALLEIREQTADNLLITYSFKHDLARMRKVFPKAPVLGGGGISAKGTGAFIQEWKAGRHTECMMFPRSASRGIDGLQDACHTMVMFGPIWSLEHHNQIIARIRRNGQRHHTVVVHIIMAADTVDEVAYAQIQRRETNQRELLNALRAYGRRKKLV